MAATPAVAVADMLEHRLFRFHRHPALAAIAARRKGLGGIISYKPRLSPRARGVPIASPLVPAPAGVLVPKLPTARENARSEIESQRGRNSHQMDVLGIHGL